MESIKYIRNRMNKNISLTKNKKEEENSLMSEKTQNDSTTVEEKKEAKSLLKSNSQKSINYSLLNNIDRNIKRRNSIENKKSNFKLLIFFEKKSNNINNNIKSNKIVNNYLLKKLPPKANNFHNYIFDLKYKCNNSSIPNVLINHLMLKNSLSNINVNNKQKYLSISIIKRIKAKKLTVLYYSPVKNG